MSQQIPTTKRRPIIKNEVRIEIRGGNVVYIRNPPNITVNIYDWDNCPECGTQDPHCPMCKAKREGVEP